MNKEYLFIHLFNETPLCLATNTNVATKLLEKGVDPNYWNNSTTIPLHRACDNGNSQLVELLLEYKANIEVKNTEKISIYVYE